MSHSSFVLMMLLGAFVLYLAVNQRLAVYLGTIGIGPQAAASGGSGNASNTAAPAASAVPGVLSPGQFGKLATLGLFG